MDRESVANAITLTLVIVITMAISVVFFDYAVIVSSCMIGSYVFFRGISLFFGGYPTESFIATVV